ncbi:hypothetical protein HELRODRAFT_94763 [Helobdella robusta]|uniref:Protein disulfide-isomerase n=1 Tax=Helobdella robusta TaxID=6412 RepID=T1G929_HELRO|nr:hypothetical protein HELRODRAFT_94763 [Helobdella robusta]ESO02710.1 hypothetical protein HELRODRAFT_94763 [Helobdella robusta]
MAVVMKSANNFHFIFIFICAFISFSLQDNDDIKVENNIYILNKDVFDRFLFSHETVLVEFYAPWCGHCKKLAPELESAADVLSVSSPNIKIAKVDATVETGLADRFEINSYPTLFVFKKGVKLEYEGPRESEGIVEEMKRIGSEDYEIPKNSSIELTAANFTDVTNAQELMVVMFYAPWCGHCKKLKPEYEKAAKELAKRKPPILMGMVDATVEKDLAELYEVQGYPTLKFFRRGKAHTFKSDARDKFGLISYIEKHLGPASTNVPTLKELKAIINPLPSSRSSVADISPFNIVAFFKDDSSKLFSLYLDAANEMRDDYSFRHTFDQSSASNWNMQADSLGIFFIERLHTKYEEKIKKMKFDDDSTVESIKNFIANNKVPLIGEFNQKTNDLMYKETRPLVIFFYTVDWSFEHKEATQMWRQRFAEVAKVHRDMTFVVADDEQNREVFHDFGFDDSGEEINVGIISKDNRRYPMEPMEEYDEQDVHDFIKKFKKGSLKPLVKSQAIPTKQAGPVTVVVGKTFEKIVLDDKKDVLIEMYAPWCGHCKQLEPIYKELAKKLKPVKNLLIAKMDATANDAPPNFPVSGFPTIYFAPTENKENPVKYEGERNVEGFIKFLKEQGVSIGGREEL